MSIQNPPKMGDTLFLMHREVIVIDYGLKLTPLKVCMGSIKHLKMG